MASQPGLTALELEASVATQAPIQTQAVNAGIAEFTHHRQLVVQRLQHHASQFNNPNEPLNEGAENYFNDHR